ncbi:hypothetical protein LTR98_011711, partial [Exophiala xenobiotica]
MRLGYTTPSGEWRACGEETVDEAMRRFILSAVCRRVTLDRVMDGRVDRVACGEREEAYD